MITDNDMAIGGHYEYLPKADIETLHYILADRENRYESRFRWEAQSELRRREQAATTPADRAFAIAQGEQECREQAAQPEAQPTPGPWEVAARRPINYEELAEFDAVWVERGAECIALVFGDPESEMLANAALIARAHKLAAENERLRGLLAAANHYCNLYRNSTDSLAIEEAHESMIEAAKEAAHAK